MAKLDCAQVFKRYEKKYLLTAPQANRLMREIQPFIQPDEYGRYTICSLYYDTDGFACYWAGKRNGQFKQKMRLRSYGVPGPDGQVFLELKKKLDGITYKRRVAFTLEEAHAYLHAGVRPAACSRQTLDEISWFKDGAGVKPQLVLAYDRLAFAGIDQPGLRITFDTHIRWRDEHLRLEDGDWGRQLLPPGSVLMEIKAGDALPLWLVRRLSAVEAYPTHFSKFNHVVEEILTTKERHRHAG